MPRQWWVICGDLRDQRETKRRSPADLADFRRWFLVAMERSGRGSRHRYIGSDPGDEGHGPGEIIADAHRAVGRGIRFAQRQNFLWLQSWI
jgi:hypothetical protein